MRALERPTMRQESIVQPWWGSAIKFIAKGLKEKVVHAMKSDPRYTFPLCVDGRYYSLILILLYAYHLNL